MSKEERVCFRCKKPFNWDDEIWSISEVKGYKSKIHDCQCGHQQSRHVPVSEKEIKLWEKLLGPL